MDVTVNITNKKFLECLLKSQMFYLSVGDPPPPIECQIAIFVLIIFMVSSLLQNLFCQINVIHVQSGKCWNPVKMLVSY